MPSCPSCGSPAPGQARFCSTCGVPLIAEAETRLAGGAAMRSRPLTATPFSTPHTDFDHGRFVPGSVLSDRFRIIGRVGRGGMGEVYRADDLRLGQQVSLKFLPEEVSQDPTRLSQFHAEVRLARQVSHPNVCRVYDIAEDAGHTFLSMEYIDGEDLASLLRRIGRLPQDKALELARQLCAGLAAAHERGVIHRDLKPANLMIDGEGRLRITDFGIAALATAGGPVAGTPGYIAPEVLTGAPAGVRSDIYALGLVLYELFTGKKAYAQSSLADVIRAQQDTQPTAPGTYVPDLDPAVERTILRCLQREPAQRPGSAMAVAAMLPGGDPLAAAIAAGETPSPDLIAAAGEADALPPARGATLVTLALAGTVALLFMADRSYLPNLLTLEKPPEVLADRASGFLAGFGYPQQPYRADGFAVSPEYLRYIARNDQSPSRWTVLRDTRGMTAYYWFRISPRQILAMSPSVRPGLHDPPMNISGQAGIILDTRARLLELHAVPPQFEETTAAPPAANWKALFDAAQLDMSRFSPAAPGWTPRLYADARAAWTGTSPEHPGVALRVDAASYRGKPVFFSLTGPWTQPSLMQQPAKSRGEAAIGAISGIIIILLLSGSVLLAWRNARQGRGDRQGATAAALLMGVLSLGSRLLRMRYVADPAALLNEVLLAVAMALLDFALMWALYMALEPAVRRFWPDALKGWARLVGGHVRDARVGRDVLYGIAVGVLMATLGVLHDILPPVLGTAQPLPTLTDVNMLLGTRFMLGSTFGIARNAIQTASISMFIVVLARMILRSRIAAVVGTIVVFIIINGGQILQSQTRALDVSFIFLLVVTIVGTLTRLGLLTGFVAFFAYQFLTNVPLTTSLAAWYGRPSAWAVMVVLGLAFAGFWLARGSARGSSRAIA